MLNKDFHASLLVALSGILYGFLGYLGTVVLQENISISNMLFWRFFIAGNWMLLFTIKNYIHGRIQISLTTNSLLYILLISSVGYACSSAFYFVASRYTGTGVAMVIFFSYPIIVAIFSWLLYRKNFTRGILVTLIVMMFGLILLRDSGPTAFNLIGIIFGTLSAFCYAFYVVASKQFSSVNINSNSLTLIVCFSCAIIFLIAALLTHALEIPNTLKLWAYLLMLGIVATALPIQLMLEGLKNISSLKASVISVLEPLVTIFVGMLLLHEVITFYQMIGTLIILTSALAIQFQKEL